MADDPVVVMKSWPEKAGNSVEEKTLKTRQKGMNMLGSETSMPPSGDPGGVTGIGEAVDERWQSSH